jgi:hypothetical protein
LTNFTGINVNGRISSCGIEQDFLSSRAGRDCSKDSVVLSRFAVEPRSALWGMMGKQVEDRRTINGQAEEATYSPIVLTRRSVFGSGLN